MATGVPKTKWKSDRASHPITTSVSAPDVYLSYEGKRAERDILATTPAELKLLWSGNTEQERTDKNRLYHGDNLPILAALLRDPAVRGHVRLVYIDPPFATQSVFQSRSQADAYSDLLAGAHYIEFIRERLILLRELLAKDGSIYVHLDDKMAFHIKVIMDEVFGRENFRNWIARKKCNPKNYTRKAYHDLCSVVRKPHI
jgi:adenine-specific DNA-methyltransferase